MPDIKIRNIVKGTVKTIDKSAVAAQHMKNAFVRTKEKAEQSAVPQDNSPDEYAVDRVSGGIHTAANKAVREFDRQGRKGLTTTRKNISKAKDYLKNRASSQPKKQIQRKAAESIRRTTGNTKKTIKTVDRGGKAIKQTTKSAAKGTVKTAQKTVKTAQRTAKTTIKTTQQAAKAAQKTAQATAKAARAAAQAARAASKAAIATAKATAKAVALTIKAIIAGTKALIAAIAAGGWVAVVVIILICLIALIVGSCFGIFFSSESSGGPTMQDVVQEINTEYTAKLDEIKLQNPHDVVEISGARADWPDVLAVYAVKTSSTQEVATIDDSKKAILKSVFWDANTINHRTESREVTEVTVTVDEDGNLVESSSTVTKDFLLITVTHKSADELAAQYGFSESQKEQLAELLSPENDSMWSAVLSGTEGADIMTVALGQVGNTGGETYWRWYGFTSRAEWCACFVSWCADQCGYIENGIIPKFAACTSQGMPWFKDRGLWQDNTYTPSPGDIIFFNWAEADGTHDGLADHVGIVERVEDGRVYTIEGNSGDMVKQNSYPIGYGDILGYGTPQF